MNYINGTCKNKYQIQILKPMYYLSFQMKQIKRLNNKIKLLKVR